MHGHGVGSIGQRIPKGVVFIGKLDGRRVEDRSFRHAVPLGEGAGGDVADDHLQRNDPDTFDQRLPLGQLFHEMGRDTCPFQPLHQTVAHPVVDDAFAADRPLLQTVECRCIVLIVHDQQLRVVCRVHLLGFAFIYQFFLLHDTPPCSFFQRRMQASRSAPTETYVIRQPTAFSIRST